MDASLSLAPAASLPALGDDAPAALSLPWEVDAEEPAPVRSAPRKIRRSGAAAIRVQAAEHLPWGVMAMTALTALLLILGARVPDSHSQTFDISTASR